MELQTKRLILREWRESDAEALYKYAQNPNIGPIAGWPPHTSVEDSREIIKNVLSADETYAVVLKTTGEAVGSIGLMTADGMHSAEIADNECEIGYWIGEPLWGQGLIPEAVNELLRHAFEDLQCVAAWCGYYDGNEKSRRVQEKCGFTFHHTEHNKPVPLLNDFRTEHFTKLLREDWENNRYMEIILRPEEETDYKTVENLTREAFWNVHFPGADEHFLVHNLRNAKEFVKELDFVAIYNNETVGNIMYARATVICNDAAHTVLTFGPVSVLPEYQNKGIGGKLINHTITLAKEMRYKCILIYGDPEYYKRFGFKASKEYGITNKDKKYPAALQVLELYPNALNGVEGMFDEGKAYEMNEQEVAQFDKTFPAKEKGYSKTQDRFNELVNQYL